MRLSETYRQLFSGVAGALVFLGVYFGQSLALWLSIGAGVGVYTATLLLIERKRSSTSLEGGAGVDPKELSVALALLDKASNRLRRLEETALSSDQGVFAKMADLLERIRAHHIRDPEDFKHTRRFLRQDLLRLVETSERYVDLSSRANPSSQPRIAQLSERIQTFIPALEKIDQACLENDFMKLEVETEVLSDQLKYR